MQIIWFLAGCAAGWIACCLVLPFLVKRRKSLPKCHHK
jgi:hypothetical protein